MENERSLRELLDDVEGSLRELDGIAEALLRAKNELHTRIDALGPTVEQPRPVESAREKGRRSGQDRRSGKERRQTVLEGLAARVISSTERRMNGERRVGVERRSGDDRRGSGRGLASPATG